MLCCATTGKALLLVLADNGWREEKGRKKEIMKEKILINHWRWLEARGYKQQAASCKRQATSLTRQQYRSIKDYEKDKKQTQ